MGIKNISDTDVSLRGQIVASGATYSVPSSDDSVWAKDLSVRMAIHSGQVNLVLGTLEFSGNAADAWLDRISQGIVVIS